MIRTKYWLSILAIAAVLITGSLAVSPIAIADDDDDDDEEVDVEYELKIEQNGNDVDVEVEAEGLATDVVFTVRAYNSDITDCSPGLLAVIGSQDSGEDGEIEISGTISSAVVDDVGSVSIRSPSGPGPLVQCFINTTP